MQAFASKIFGQTLAVSGKVKLLEASVDHAFFTQSRVASITEAVVCVSIWA